MEEIKNCPCLDTKKVIESLKLICENHGYDFSVLVQALVGAHIGWFSRSIAASLFVFCKDENDEWRVLASERGEEAADFQGKWNCVCGYLDFGETVAQCAIRECFEEVGIKLSPSQIFFVGYEDSPSANRQNVTFRFCTFIEDKKTNDFIFSHKGNEGKEVGAIKWLTMDEVDKLEWAFCHKERIKEIFKTFSPNSNA